MRLIDLMKEVKIMPIENKLRVVMANKRIDSISELIEITGVSRNSLNKLWHNEDVESIKLETLVKICRALDIELNQLITYVPQK